MIIVIALSLLLMLSLSLLLKFYSVPMVQFNHEAVLTFQYQQNETSHDNNSQFYRTGQ